MLPVTKTLLDSRSIWIDDTFLSDHAALFTHLVTSIAWDERIRSRKAASFGLPYNYSGTVWPETAFPAILVQVLDHVEARLGYRPTNCLALYYEDGGSSLGYHSDSTASLVPGTGIAVLSLGAERAISFRHQITRVVESYALRSGSMLWMTAAMQSSWKHGVLSDRNVTGGRISLAFRCMVRDEGLF